VWLLLNDEAKVCQLRILVEEHPCLDYDSWVNCYQIFPFDEVELIHKREQVGVTIKQDILTAVDGNSTLTQKLKKAIRRSAAEHDQARRPAQP